MMTNLSQKGVSNWLMNLPIKENGYELMKQELWDHGHAGMPLRLDKTGQLIEFISMYLWGII